MADPGSNSGGAFSPWTAICLACRSALATVGACEEDAAHRVVNLMTRDGQEELLAAVWAGPETLGLSGDLRPRGAPDGSLRLAGMSARRGIAEGIAAPSPLGREPCLAYGLTLLTNRPAFVLQDVMWREAATMGFTVRLEEGAVMRVPPGRVRFEVDRQRAYYAPRDQAAEHLPAGLGIHIIGEPDFVPFDAALEDVLRPGDAVELVGTVELREDTTAEQPSPRTPAPTVLVPSGTPSIRRVD
jgi:hypothetical protein